MPNVMTSCRERQQSRDAAQLARRARAARARGGGGLPRRRRARHHGAPARRPPSHHARRCARHRARVERTAPPAVEYNIEGDPRPELLDLVEEVRPDQCTLVPVAPGEVTSQAGWRPGPATERLPAVDPAPARGRRPRQPVRRCRRRTRSAGRHRPAPIASSSTPSRSRAPSSTARTPAADRSRPTPRRLELAHRLGLGVNAGHDLDLANLTLFRDAAVPRRGLDRPRDHVARALRRPRHRRPRVPGGCSRARATLRYDRTRPPPMKSDAIAFGIAGILFGLIAGWIIGSQQAVVRPPAAAPLAQQPSASSGGTAPRAAVLDETQVNALKTVAEREPVQRDAARAARQPLLRRRDVRRRDQVVWRRVEAGAQGRQRQHRPRRLVLLFEPAGQGARPSSTSRSSSIPSTPRRCSTSAS